MEAINLAMFEKELAAGNDCAKRLQEIVSEGAADNYFSLEEASLVDEKEFVVTLPESLREHYGKVMGRIRGVYLANLTSEGDAILYLEIKMPSHTASRYTTKPEFHKLLETGDIKICTDD